jgi:hypothetical protein
MSVFVLDLWHDLRAKRLAPVAVLLAVALFAVPIFLLKSAPASETASNVPPPSASDAETAKLIEAVEHGTFETSDLDRFDRKDPFMPLRRLSVSNGGASPLSPTSELPGGSGSGGTEPAGGGTSVATGGGDTGTGGATGGSPAGPVKRKGKTTFYTYVVDVEFGKRGEENERKGVKRLTILPSERNPLLVFLGVSTDRKRALFLADSTLSQSGEGKCKPDVDTCTFITLTTAKERNEHYVTDQDGQEWVMRLVDIRRVKLDTKKKRPKKGAHDSRQRRTQKSPRQRVGRVFKSLLFTDSAH